MDHIDFITSIASLQDKNTNLLSASVSNINPNSQYVIQEYPNNTIPGTSIGQHQLIRNPVSSHSILYSDQQNFYRSSQQSVINSTPSTLFSELNTCSNISTSVIPNVNCDFNGNYQNKLPSIEELFEGGDRQFDSQTTSVSNDYPIPNVFPDPMMDMTNTSMNINPLPTLSSETLKVLETCIGDQIINNYSSGTVRTEIPTNNNEDLNILFSQVQQVGKEINPSFNIVQSGQQLNLPTAVEDVAMNVDCVTSSNQPMEKRTRKKRTRNVSLDQSTPITKLDMLIMIQNSGSPPKEKSLPLPQFCDCLNPASVSPSVEQTLIQYNKAIILHHVGRVVINNVELCSFKRNGVLFLSRGQLDHRCMFPKPLSSVLDSFFIKSFPAMCDRLLNEEKDYLKQRNMLPPSYSKRALLSVGLVCWLLDNANNNKSGKTVAYEKVLGHKCEKDNLLHVSQVVADVTNYTKLNTFLIEQPKTKSSSRPDKEYVVAEIGRVILNNTSLAAFHMNGQDSEKYFVNCHQILTLLHNFMMKEDFFQLVGKFNCQLMPAADEIVNHYKMLDVTLPDSFFTSSWIGFSGLKSMCLFWMGKTESSMDGKSFLVDLATLNPEYISQKKFLGHAFSVTYPESFLPQNQSITCELPKEKPDQRDDLLSIATRAIFDIETNKVNSGRNVTGQLCLQTKQKSCRQELTNNTYIAPPKNKKNNSNCSLKRKLTTCKSRESELLQNPAKVPKISPKVCKIHSKVAKTNLKVSNKNPKEVNVTVKFSQKGKKRGRKPKVCKNALKQNELGTTEDAPTKPVANNVTISCRTQSPRKPSAAEKILRNIVPAVSILPCGSSTHLSTTSAALENCISEINPNLQETSDNPMLSQAPNLITIFQDQNLPEASSHNVRSIESKSFENQKTAITDNDDNSQFISNKLETLSENTNVTVLANDSGELYKCVPLFSLSDLVQKEESPTPFTNPYSPVKLQNTPLKNPIVSVLHPDISTTSPATRNLENDLTDTSLPNLNDSKVVNQSLDSLNESFGPFINRNNNSKTLNQVVFGETPSLSDPGSVQFSPMNDDVMLGAKTLVKSSSIFDTPLTSPVLDKSTNRSPIVRSLCDRRIVFERETTPDNQFQSLNMFASVASDIDCLDKPFTSLRVKKTRLPLNVLNDVNIVQTVLRGLTINQSTITNNNLSLNIKIRKRLKKKISDKCGKEKIQKLMKLIFLLVSNTLRINKHRKHIENLKGSEGVKQNTEAMETNRSKISNPQLIHSSPHDSKTVKSQLTTISPVKSRFTSLKTRLPVQKISPTKNTLTSKSSIRINNSLLEKNKSCANLRATVQKEKSSLTIPSELTISDQKSNVNKRKVSDSRTDINKIKHSHSGDSVHNTILCVSGEQRLPESSSSSRPSKQKLETTPETPKQCVDNLTGEQRLPESSFSSQPSKPVVGEQNLETTPETPMQWVDNLTGEQRLSESSSSTHSSKPVVSAHSSKPVVSVDNLTGEQRLSESSSSTHSSKPVVSAQKLETNTGCSKTTAETSVQCEQENLSLEDEVEIVGFSNEDSESETIYAVPPGSWTNYDQIESPSMQTKCAKRQIKQESQSVARNTDKNVINQCTNSSDINANNVVNNQPTHSAAVDYDSDKGNLSSGRNANLPTLTALLNKKPLLTFDIPKHQPVTSHEHSTQYYGNGKRIRRRPVKYEPEINVTHRVKKSKKIHNKDCCCSCSEDETRPETGKEDKPTTEKNKDCFCSFLEESYPELLKKGESKTNEDGFDNYLEEDTCTYTLHPKFLEEEVLYIVPSDYQTGSGKQISQIPMKDGLLDISPRKRKAKSTLQNLETTQQNSGNRSNDYATNRIGNYTAPFVVDDTSGETYEIFKCI
ncbi:hypothetical protein SNE40_008344 [Patella caerulea]|uniref:Uncharacterized protein n=1 Tax=Patella caerulea TaxID=87958 RepID=A0AAN8K7Z0_PATCE